MIKPSFIITFCILLPGLYSCSNSGSSTEAENTDTTQVSLNESPSGEFQDITSTDHWRNYLKNTLSSNWKNEDSMLVLTPGGGDIVTKQEYENFELEMDWKISEGGNSGLFFYVVESDTLEAVYHSGPEYQLLDNERHADAKIRKHRTGDNYDVQQSSVETVKPAGEWNHTRLVVNNGHVEHFLNGEKVVEYDLWTPAWEDSVAQSKFAELPAYGKAKSGHIALQDHGDEVWFQNIKIKEL